VSIRADDENTTQALWEYRNDGMALGFDEVQLQKLLGHPPAGPITRRVILGVFEALGKEVVVQFDMPQDPAILMQACALN